MKSALSVLCALSVLGVAAQASAQDTPFRFGPQPGWQVLAGPTGGGSFGSPGAGGFAGAELSASRLMAGWWTGGYVDAAYDFGQSAALVTGGPQVGYAFLGVDGGAAARFDTDELAWGPQARLMLSAGFFTLYGRYAYLLDPSEHVGQVGVMFKLPVWADE